MEMKAAFPLPIDFKWVKARLSTECNRDFSPTTQLSMSTGGTAALQSRPNCAVPRMLTCYCVPVHNSHTAGGPVQLSLRT